MQAKLLESFINVVGINHPKLQQLLTQLQQEPHILTSDLQTTLEDISRISVYKK